MTPIAIALAGVIWPPVARGNIAFPAMVGLGVAGAAVPRAVDHRRRHPAPGVRLADPAAVVRGRLPVADRAAGDQPVQRVRGRPPDPGRDGPAPAPPARRAPRSPCIITVLSGVLFATVAVANDMALRDTPRVGVALRADDRDGPAAALRRAARAGSSARLDLHMTGTVDLRPIGSIDLAGRRVGRRLPLARLCRHQPTARPVRLGQRRAIGPGRRPRRAAGDPASRRSSPTTRSTSRRSGPP